MKVSTTATARARSLATPNLTVEEGYAEAFPDVNGSAKLVVDGLLPGTRYHDAVVTGGVVDHASRAYGQPADCPGGRWWT